MIIIKNIILYFIQIRHTADLPSTGTRLVCIRLPSLAVAGEPGKRHARRAHKPQVFSDWLNPKSLGIMSAFSYIENLA